MTSAESPSAGFQVGFAKEHDGGRLLVAAGQCVTIRASGSAGHDAGFQVRESKPVEGVAALGHGPLHRVEETVGEPPGIGVDPVRDGGDDEVDVHVACSSQRRDGLEGRSDVRLVDVGVEERREQLQDIGIGNRVADRVVEGVGRVGRLRGRRLLWRRRAQQGGHRRGGLRPRTQQKRPAQREDHDDTDDLLVFHRDAPGPTDRVSGGGRPLILPNVAITVETSAHAAGPPRAACIIGAGWGARLVRGGSHQSDP